VTQVTKGSNSDPSPANKKETASKSLRGWPHAASVAESFQLVEEELPFF
jgi:hypothetical protein